MEYQQIFVTGDPHEEFSHLHEKQKMMHMTGEDLLVILGDVGVNCYNDERDIRLKEDLSQLAPTVLCLHGNHERRPISPDIRWKYEAVSWHGGRAFVESRFPSLIFAEDGERYRINGRTFRVIGGAYSIDDYFRTLKGHPFYPDEQLSSEERADIRKKMERDGWREDVILTHTCPYSVRPLEKFVPGIQQEGVDTSMEDFLEEILQKASFNQWFCGHWHVEKTVGKIRFLSHDVVLL